MDQKGEIESAVLCEQIPQVQCFVQNFTYYRNLLSCTKFFEDSDFIDEVSNAFLGVATLSWCNVFGSDRSDSHWSKLIKNMPIIVKQDFLYRIYKSTDLNEEDYQKCRDNIICLRDKYVAHRDRNWKEHNWNSSDFENALKIAIAYECWVNDLLQKEASPSINSLADIIKSAEGEIKHVTALLSSQKR